MRAKSFLVWLVILGTLGTMSLASTPAQTGTKPRARDLGIPFEGTPGPLNAITDVRGVEVGQVTIISGEGKLVVGQGPVRTGVTVVFPQGKSFRERLFGAWFTLNGNGEMTGTTWLKESGCLGSPILITNTQSVGVVRDAVIEWNVKHGPAGDYSGDFSLPVVAETWDGFLNDIDGFHVKKEHVFEALDRARPGPVAEGNVGGGTGMICYGFKGGTGTSSRVVDRRDQQYTVGVLVQTNHGNARQLVVAGVPVGLELPEGLGFDRGKGSHLSRESKSSIIIVIATDAPLLPHQLKRIARRASLGLARTGSISANGSGDIFLAFSTANAGASERSGEFEMTALANTEMNPLFEATVQATEEAIINSLIAAETMEGFEGKVVALPQDLLLEILRKYNRVDAVQKQ